MRSLNDYESTQKSKSVFTEVYTEKKRTWITVIVVAFIIGIFTFAYITFGNENVDDSTKASNTLKLVSIIAQHGQTSPKFTYPNDPYGNDSRWLVSLGELSKKGKQNMYSLGKFFRERYSGFLPELYFSSDIQVLSPNSDTCLMSAAVLLAGLYPPHKFQIWNPHVLWQPIPIKGISAEVDNMLDVTQECPQLIKTLKQIENDIIGQDENLPKLYDFLTDNTGMEVRNLSTVLALYNLLKAQDRNNLLLPEWVGSVYPNRILKYALEALKIGTENSEITKLTTGILLEKIISDSIKKRENALSTKMFLYSTHEKSIYNMLRVLDNEKFTEVLKKPEFTSSVMIELHVIKNETILQAFYLEKSGKRPIAINITQCADPCLFDNFIKFAKILIPGDWKTSCLL